MHHETFSSIIKDLAVISSESDGTALEFSRENLRLWIVVGNRQSNRENGQPEKRAGLNKRANSRIDIPFRKTSCGIREQNIRHQCQHCDSNGLPPVRRRCSPNENS
jgi:hypothetical protein